MYLSPGWPEEEDRKIGGQELELGDQGTIHSGEKKKNSFAFVRIYQSNVFMQQISCWKYFSRKDINLKIILDLQMLLAIVVRFHQLLTGFYENFYSSRKHYLWHYNVVFDVGV